jgi:hypothetical protein
MEPISTSPRSVVVAPEAGAFAYSTEFFLSRL